MLLLLDAKDFLKTEKKPLMMESEDCAFLSQPKHNKWRKVSAFRDFPEGCGRDAIAVAKGRNRKRNYVSCRSVSAVRDFPPLCGRGIASCLGEGESPMRVYNSKKQVEKNVEDDGYACDGRVIDMVEKEEEDVFGKCFTIPEQSEGEMESKMVVEGNGHAALIAGTSGKEIVVYQEVQDLGTTGPLDMSDSRHELKSRHKLKGGFNGLKAAPPRRTVVLGLMAESGCPWMNGKQRTRKRVNFHLQRDSTADIKAKDSKNQYKKPSPKKKGNSASKSTGELIREQRDSLYPNDSNVTRNKVREMLCLSQIGSRKLLCDEESKVKELANCCRRNGLQAEKILGPVPGVDVGDKFQYRVDLNILGLHQQNRCDIDYKKHNGKILATSVVVLGDYVDALDKSDVLIYTWLGGNTMSTHNELENKKHEKGNLALKNSIEEKNPVRVIRCIESMHDKCRTYVYDGQYVVESCCQYRGPHGKLGFRFSLRRIRNQLELSCNEVRKSKRFKTREGLCVDDISNGKEVIPICAVNTIDDETTPPFEYVTSMIYPNWCNPIPPVGCDCTIECSSSKKCSCAVQNGGVIPFNYDGAIVEGKPLVYECGPSCRCPPTCYNRVSQRGIKFQLEIFKTMSRGWGVRSRNSIPSGSFICEYIGELLGEDEADERVGNDEYLFDIGNNYINHSLKDGLPDAPSTSCNVVEDGVFTIDAAHYGNVGRFINHSCSPNLYAQNLLYDHDDKRIPHIMLFAVEDIPPLQELTYDYNYKIDQVYDSEGNIKKKYCYCGSVECTGRLY